MKHLTDKQGFTLIEIIVVLVIMGIMAIGLNSAITYGVQSFVFARNADLLSQKAQLAMARINRELTDITAISFADASRIDYTSPKNSPSCTLDEGCQYSLQISVSGTQITLERTTAPAVTARVLIDGLTASNNGIPFLSYSASSIPTGAVAPAWFSTLTAIKVQISLDIAGGTPLYFQSTINPRATGILTAPKLN